MAVSTGFSTSITGQTTWSKRAVKCSPITVPVNKSHQLQQAESKIALELLCVKRVIKRKPKRPCVVQSSDSDKHFTSPLSTNPLSPAYQMMQFYTAINEKNFKKLDTLLDEKCLFEDLTFPKPFKEKKEVLHFLEKLMECMGQHMQFNVEHICEGNENTAAVSWHLDWNEIEVPFTKGCSHYELVMNGNGDKLIIKKAQIITESPIKLGALALMIFRIVTTLFDAFPKAAKWFLRSHQVIFKLLLNTYERYIRPIMAPFLGWYIKLFDWAASILSFTLKLLYYLAKLFQI